MKPKPSPKPVILRSAAEDDISSATAHYLEEGSTNVALRLVRSLESCVETLSEQPEIGSPRFAHELDFPGLRTWPVDDFPYLIFYIELEDQIQVWRVLHVRRDLAAWFSLAEE
ncbi:MAG TPA: type II toxin-antitoxin system RelE/ParE family toxin [Trueperaceae bacterium]|nr:type II toxin-antitoxin system RelE/ParE family toxin [Trueperaceae bacterium]